MLCRSRLRRSCASPTPCRTPVRRPTGWPGSGPVRLLFLGHLDDRKGVPELLRSLALPALRERAWQIDLAGGGENARFRAEARSLGLAERATFHGWLSQESVEALCRAADIFVLPSHAEGQAMALLEAMAHGLAIVTTPVGAHLEAVSPGREAIILQPGDIELHRAGAFDRRAGAPCATRRSGSTALPEAFDISRYAVGLAGLYDEVLAEAARPGEATATAAMAARGTLRQCQTSTIPGVIAKASSASVNPTGRRQGGPRSQSGSARGPHWHDLDVLALPTLGTPSETSPSTTSMPGPTIIRSSLQPP